MRRMLQITALILVLLLGAAGGAYWYLFSAPILSADQLVPSETVFFATIPNAVPLLAGYQGSDLKKILDDPTAQAGLASLKDFLGKNDVDALQTFLPELSGQSFLALTHLDPDHPENCGFIAGLKPLPGTDHFDDFVTKFKEACGTQIENWPVGSGSVGGLTYNWFQPPGVPGHLCVLRHQGWILVSLGSDALEDWLQRYQKKSTSPSLSQNPDYQTSLQRVGTDNLTLLYFNPTRLVPILANYLEKSKMMPSMPAQMEAYQAFSLMVIGDKFQNGKIVDNSSMFLTQLIPTLSSLLETYQALSLVVIGDKFQNGKIVDNSSIFLTPTSKTELGLSDTPCTFDTLKFTDRNTCLYLAGNRDWNLVSQRVQRNFQKMPPAQLALLTMQAQTLKNLGIDLQHNIINALGPEFSIQMDWDADTSFPDLGLFFKIDKPDDFQPVIKAIHDLVYKLTSNFGVITELTVNGQKFATFHFAPKEGQFTPTITVNGPYFAFFLTQKYAANCFSRDPNGLLTTSPDFQEAVGDRLTSGGNATDLIFINSPDLLDRAYQAALPLIVMTAQTNSVARTFLRDHEMPKNLTWLTPIGAWTNIQFRDEAGLRGYSYSGAGNQGLFLGSAAVAAVIVAPSLMPKTAPPVSSQPIESPVQETSAQRAGMLRDELSQLRVTIMAWTKDKKIAPGTPVTWGALTGYFIPDSRLEQSGGKDALGHYYDLGGVGVQVADVSAETKKAFPDQPDSFWTVQPDETSLPASALPVATPVNSDLAPPPEPTSHPVPPAPVPPSPQSITNMAPVTPAPVPPSPPPITNLAPVVPAPVPPSPPPITNMAPVTPAPVPPSPPPITNLAPVAPAPIPPSPPPITNLAPVAPAPVPPSPPPITNLAPVAPPDNSAHVTPPPPSD